MLTAILMRHTQLSDAIFSQQIVETEAASGSIWNAVESFIQVMLFQLENPGFVRLMSSQALLASQADTVTFEFFSNRMSTRRAMHTSFFAALIAEGYISESTCPQESADLLIAVVDGLRTQFLLDLDSAKYMAALHAYLRMVFEPHHLQTLQVAFLMTRETVSVSS